MKPLKQLIWGDNLLISAQNSLSIQGFSVVIDDKTVVDDVTITVSPGEIVALIGPNGAGKSELVLGIAGCLPHRTGSVSLDDIELIDATPEKVRSHGIAVVPEGHQVFPNLTVMDNLFAAGSLLNQNKLEKEIENAFAILPELQALKNNRAGLLSGGQQQMVALAQAIISAPKYLLIDELSLGLAPIIVDRLMKVICELKDKGIGVLLIEQFTQLALELADQAIIMNHGKILFSGQSQQLRNEPEIIQNIYLGSDRTQACSSSCGSASG